MTEKTALITGVTGQDGALLAELLLQKGYTVHGLRRRSSVSNTERLSHLLADGNPFAGRLHLHFGDMTDSDSLVRALQVSDPDEVYNLAAQSHVQVSFETVGNTAEVNAVGVARLLEAIRSLGLTKRTKFYQASTSELFGNSPPPQNEQTLFAPRSPYAISKLYGYWITVNARAAYGLHASNGILFNHEGPTRGESFVTRKITRAAAAIDAGLQQILELGNLDARRDWGLARDYVDGMWRILQQEQADDYVLATGETHTVREFTELAFQQVGVQLTWSGSGVAEVGADSTTGIARVRVNERFFRPTEVNHLVGDASKAKAELGWTPTVPFAELVADMVKADRDRIRSSRIVPSD